jgi:hypothetical protein
MAKKRPSAEKSRCKAFLEERMAAWPAPGRFMPLALAERRFRVPQADRA